MEKIICCALVIYLVASMVIGFILRKSLDKKKRILLNSCLIAGSICSLLILWFITKTYLIKENVITTSYSLLPMNYTTTAEHDIYLGVWVQNDSDTSDTPTITLLWRTEQEEYSENIMDEKIDIYFNNDTSATMTVKNSTYSIFGYNLPKKLSKTTYELNLPDGEANCVYMQGAPKIAS